MPTRHEFFITISAKTPIPKPNVTKTYPKYTNLSTIPKFNSKIQFPERTVSLSKMSTYIIVEVKIETVSFNDLPLIEFFVDTYVFIFLTAKARIKNTRIKPKYIFPIMFGFNFFYSAFTCYTTAK